MFVLKLFLSVNFLSVFFFLYCVLGFLLATSADESDREFTIRIISTSFGQ